jgi:hypothetical protein
MQCKNGLQRYNRRKKKNAQPASAVGRTPPWGAPNSEGLREQAIERPISNLMDRGRPCRDESHFFCLWRWTLSVGAFSSETISPLPSAPVARDNNRSSGKWYEPLPRSRTANTYSRARHASGSPPSASATAFSKFCVSGLPCVGATKAANCGKTRVQVSELRFKSWQRGLPSEPLNPEACPSSQLQLVQFAPIWFAFRFRLGRGRLPRQVRGAYGKGVCCTRPPSPREPPHGGDYPRHPTAHP